MIKLSPPFPYWPLERPDRHLNPIFAAARHRFPIIDSKVCKTVMAFQTYCCPQVPSPLGMELTTEFLLWSIVVNDVDDLTDRARRIESFREGLLFKNGTSDLHRGGEHFASRLAVLPDGDSVLVRMNLMLEALLWQAATLNEARKLGRDVDLRVDQEASRQRRVHLNGGFSYIALWRQCQGWKVLNQNLVECAEEISTRVVARGIDIARCISGNVMPAELNSILTMPNDSHTVNQMRAAYFEYQDWVDELAVLVDTATSDFDYLQYLKATVSGNVRAMQHLLARSNVEDFIGVPN